MNRPSPSKIAYPRRQRRAIGAAVLWAITFPIVFAAIGKLVGQLAGMPPGPPTWLAPALLGGIGLGAAIAALVHRASKGRPGTMRRDGDALVVERAGTTRSVPMSEVDSGWTSKQPDGTDRVGVTLRGGETIHLDLPGGEGQSKLEELGLDASKRRLRLSLWSGFESVLMGFAGAVLGGLAWLPLGGIGGDVLSRLDAADLAAPLALATLVPMMVLGVLVMRRAEPEVTIGSDGVGVAGGSLRAKRRFYPFERIAGVDVTRGVNARNLPDVVVRLKLVGAGGGADDVEIARLLSSPSTDTLVETLVRRVHEAMAARAAAPEAEASGLLDGMGEGIGPWIASLRKLASVGDGYRAVALGRDRLVALVDDARAAARSRIAAAVVLAEQGDTEGLSRVRVAADACASPRVRVALERVADGSIDEQAIAEAIEDEEAASAERAVPVRA